MGQFHEDHELVAADPRKGVRLANPASHALGDLLKQAVPRLVAERVVDRFEAVDVEKKQPDLTSAPCRSGKHLRQTFTEVRPVGELGHLALPRKPRDPALRASVRGACKRAPETQMRTEGTRSPCRRCPREDWQSVPSPGSRRVLRPCRSRASSPGPARCRRPYPSRASARAAKPGP